MQQSFVEWRRTKNFKRNTNRYFHRGGKSCNRDMQFWTCSPGIFCKKRCVVHRCVTRCKSLIRVIAFRQSRACAHPAAISRSLDGKRCNRLSNIVPKPVKFGSIQPWKRLEPGECFKQKQGNFEAGPDRRMSISDRPLRVAPTVSRLWSRCASFEFPFIPSFVQIRVEFSWRGGGAFRSTYHPR